MLDKVSRILLVEDNEADVYLFRKALETADLQFELTVMGDGAEALAFVRRERKYSASSVPNLVALDLNLPKDGGIQVLRASGKGKISLTCQWRSSAPRLRRKIATKPENSALTVTSRSPLIWNNFFRSAKHSESCSLLGKHPKRETIRGGDQTQRALVGFDQQLTTGNRPLLGPIMMLSRVCTRLFGSTWSPDI